PRRRIGHHVRRRRAPAPCARRRRARGHLAHARRRPGAAHPRDHRDQEDGERVIAAAKPGRYGEFGGQYLPEPLMPAVAETGAGQHGVASAAACALLGLECVVYMGTVDARRQQPNVFRMKLLGAEVREVDAGSRTLKDAVNEAIRDWVTNVRTTYYLLGSAIGPHPYPAMVRDFQAVIGREAREQMLAMLGALPDVVVACVGGGSNAIGMFSAFIDDPAVKLIGVEAGGEGIASGKHAASIVGGSVG